MDKLFGDTALNIAASFIASCLFVLLGFFLSKIRTRIASRVFKRFWNHFLAGGHTAYFVFGGRVHSEAAGYNKISLSLPMATALTEFTAHITRSYDRNAVDMFQATEFPTSKLSDNLIIVGGPRANQFYEVLNQHLAFPVCLEENTGIVADSKFESLIVDGALLKDYGFVTIAPNPFNPDRMVCLFAGIHSHGSLAAVVAMTMPIIRDVLKKVNDKRAFVAVVESHVVSNFVSRPTVVHVCDLNYTGLARRESHPPVDIEAGPTM